MRKAMSIVCLCLFVSTFLALSADALHIQLGGNLRQDNSVEVFRFQADKEEVTFYSYSWYLGGFDPYGTISDSGNNYITEMDDGYASKYLASDGTEVNLGGWDFLLTVNLVPGEWYNYYLTQYDNDPVVVGGKITGFTYDDDPHFTQSYSAMMGYDPAPDFNGVYWYNGPDYRTSQWLVGFDGVRDVVDMSTVPEPTTIFAWSAGLLGVFGIVRSKKSRR